MFLQLLFIVLGLIFGSFVAAFTWRYPKNISVLKGRSICPKCKNKIAWYDNIPLLSYIALKGKCRNCKKNISWRYPVIEFISSAGFIFIYFFTIKDTALQGVYSISFLIYYLVIFEILFLILLSILIIDFEHQIIPDGLVFFGIVFWTLAFLLFLGKGFLFTSLFAGFICATFLLLIHLATKGRGMGLGDVKFAVLGGIIVGLKLSAVWLFLSFLTGGVAGIILIVLKRAGLKDKIAFGPFLIAGLLFTFLFGSKLMVLLGF